MADLRTGDQLGEIADALRRAGCVAAVEEAGELRQAACGDGDRLAALVERRCAGEPLAWIVGSVRFCGEQIVVHRGVYVPRWQSEHLAREAVARLGPGGAAVDLCTGSGAIAAVLARRRPSATVLATEIDPLAAACARANGVEVLIGDLTRPVPARWQGKIDVVTAVVPYVPTGDLAFLPRDVVAYEPQHALDGGPEGTSLLARAVLESAPLLREGGSLLLELGGAEDELLEPVLAAAGFRGVERLVDEDGELRSLACRR